MVENTLGTVREAAKKDLSCSNSGGALEQSKKSQKSLTVATNSIDSVPCGMS